MSSRWMSLDGQYSARSLLRFFEAADPALVGTHKLITLGHDAKIIPAKIAKAYVKSNKSETIDGEAIAEAVIRPTMRFVQVRSDAQVDLQALHRIPGRLVRNRRVS